MTEKWDRFFLGMAKYVATASKDPSTQCGAVIANDLQQVVGLGYNGFARRINDAKGRYENREIKYKLIVHAEVNAIIQAGHAARGATLYIYPSFMMPPICHECGKVAIQAGIKEVIGFNPTSENEERMKRWQESICFSQQMFIEAGIKWKELVE